MASKVRGTALALVVALLAPALAPLVQGASGDSDGCACRTRCCRAPQRPMPEAGPCHGAQRDAPSCSMRCNHARGQTPVTSLAPFLPEADTSVVALILHPDEPRTFRPTTRTGFDRIESPPPRPLLLAI